MESERIEELLEKYWACETSLEEEKQLKAFFSQPNLPAEWAKHQAMFQYFGKEGEKVLETSMDETISRKLSLKPNRKPLIYNLMRVAASLLIVLSCAYFYQQSNKVETQETAVMQDTFSDPQEAYDEVRKALMKVSKDLNKGTQYMVSIKQINEGTKYFKQEEKQKP